jgi:hypothetical protein
MHLKNFARNYRVVEQLVSPKTQKFRRTQLVASDFFKVSLHRAWSGTRCTVVSPTGNLDYPVFKQLSERL